MLTAIKSLLSDRRDRQEMLYMRAMMESIHVVLFPKDEMTGALANEDRPASHTALRNPVRDYGA